MSRELKTSFREGDTLAQHYYILGTLGKGSFARVKLALHLMTHTLVAIKILKRGKISDFLIISEIELMKSLQHRHIIQLLQVFQTRHETYLVMEYASRGSLLKYIKKHGPLDEEEACTIFSELSLAVNYIHSQNIAHRDIKAENILLDWDGHVKLTDFGISKRLASGGKFKGFCGTAKYCAPEVFNDTPYDGLPSDIWSLGIVLYYLVIGHLPFQGTTHSNIKYMILSQSWKIPYLLSPELRDLMIRLMTIDPTMRPSIREVVAHPWLRHDQDILTQTEEIPRQPETNIAFYHDGGQGGTLDPTKDPNLPWPLRRVTSDPSFTLTTLSEQRGDRRKSRKRRHRVPPTLSSLKSKKSGFLKNTSPQQELMPGAEKGTCSEEGSINATTSSGSKTTSTATTSDSGTTDSLFTASQISTFENIHVANESSGSSDTSSSSSSWESTTRSPFPSEGLQGEKTGTECLQDSSSSYGETDHQEQLRRQSQGVPRVPLRRWGWKGPKKRIVNPVRSLCCCIPVTNNEIRQPMKSASETQAKTSIRYGPGMESCEKTSERL
ncbi:sperm motility kinase X-like [Mus caroli]|uniref:non-specific serine/threonine protein kinase n=1 Tax=Mus caroli TaxID=10089 RepID=A0A6P5PD42_MUSCR|nr:sperm motility kinase X-like [Mus caroli]